MSHPLQDVHAATPARDARYAGMIASRNVAR